MVVCIAGRLAVGIIREFMTWAGLSFSAKVFDPEVGVAEKLDRVALQDQLVRCLSLGNSYSSRLMPASLPASGVEEHQRAAIDIESDRQFSIQEP